MDINAVDPDIRAALSRVEMPDVRRSAARRLVRFALPLAVRQHKLPGVTTRTVRAGVVRARVSQPANPTSRGALLWIHGGGLIIGAAKQDDWLCVPTAAELGIAVVSAEYRLAPEHPFPAAIDDVNAVWQWMLENSDELGIDPARIVIGGESAGGGLAACLAQRLRDTSPVQPIGQWLFCPMLDDRTAARRELDAVDHWVWNNGLNHFGWSSYLRQEPGGEAVPPYSVAARGDVAELPPTWMSAGDIELFHEEIADFARRLEAAGVEVTLDVVAGAPHGFENWAGETAPAQALVARSRTWLAARLAGARTG